MSGIPETRRLWITPLSPVHMGTDEDYTPTGYVIDGNALYEFDHRALRNLPAEERRKLDSLLNGRATQDMLKGMQAFFHRNREWLIPASTNIVPVSEEMAKLHQARVGKAANIESGGRQVLNTLEIERAAYNPLDRRLFLPGTGLKGAMRTALLDAVNDGRGARRDERDRDLQQRLFRYSTRDLQKDPMRLVQVGDCAWRAADELNSAEVLFAVNRKKKPVRQDGQLLASRAEQQNLNQLLECATPFRFRAFQGLLSVSELGGLEDRNGRLPELRFSFGEVATACNRYFQPIFERETALLAERGYLDGEWRETVDRLLGDGGIARRLAANDAFLLRVGRHSGAESVTLNGVRSIKIMGGKNQKPTWEAEAKTVWLATGDRQDKRYLRPFGWLLVELTELDEEPPAWPAAEMMIEEHARDMREWLRAVEQRKHALADRIEKAREEAERKAEEAAKRAAEQAKRATEEAARLQKAEAARQAELAGMEPIEREIAEFPAVLDAINALRQSRWKGEEQRKAAGFIRKRMEKEKCWRPQSKAKKPAKDKPYQRTLIVMRFLESP